MAYMSQEGYDKLIAELQRLEGVERPKASAAIAEAREKGDLSENSEYDAAKEAQAHLEDKINQLKMTIAEAKVIDTSRLSTDSVQILSKVEMTNLTNKANYPYGYRDIGGVSQINKKIFDQQLFILLGEGDTIRDANLNTSLDADKQGLNRWQRGHSFFSSAQTYAAKRKCACHWQLDTVPHTAHSSSRMADYAADLLYNK